MAKRDKFFSLLNYQFINYIFIPIPVPAGPSVPVLLEGDGVVGEVGLDEVLVVVDLQVADDALVQVLRLGEQIL